MSEFRIHHDVNELLSLLRVHGGDGAEVYIELLQKNRTPYVTTTVSAHSAKVGRAPPPPVTPRGALGPHPVEVAEAQGRRWTQPSGPRRGALGSPAWTGGSAVAPVTRSRVVVRAPRWV